MFRVKNAARTIPEIEHVRRIVYDAVLIWNSVSNLELFESQGEEFDVELSFESNFEDPILAKTIEEENKTQIYFNDNLNWTYFSTEKGLKR